MHDHVDGPDRLAPLGIEEVRERLEFSPLAAAVDTDPILREGPSCTCKVFQPHDPDEGDWVDDDLYWWQRDH